MDDPKQYGDGDETEKQGMRQFWTRINTSGLWVLFAFGAVLILSVIGLAFIAKDLGVRATILAAGIPAVLTFIIVVIQAAVSKQMADIMVRQEAEMTLQREIAHDQWQAMVQGLEQAKDMFDLVERPVIFVEDAGDAYNPLTKTLCPKIVLRNAGRMAAKDVQVYIGLSQDVLNFPIDKGNLVPINIGLFPAEQTFTVIPNESENVIAMEDERNIRALRYLVGDSALRVYGYGSYRDMGMDKEKSRKFTILPFVFRYQPEMRDYFPDFERIARLEGLKLEFVPGEMEGRILSPEEAEEHKKADKSED